MWNVLELSNHVNIFRFKIVYIIKTNLELDKVDEARVVACVLADVVGAAFVAVWMVKFLTSLFQRRNVLGFIFDFVWVSLFE